MALKKHFLLGFTILLLGCMEGLPEPEQRQEAGIEPSVATPVEEETLEELPLSLDGGDPIPADVSPQIAIKKWPPHPIESDYETCFPEKIAVEEEAGPHSKSIDIEGWKGNTVYVDGRTDGDGQKESPFRSVGIALEKTRDPEIPTLILVAGGTYEESSLSIGGGQYFFGGFDPKGWERNLVKYPSVIQLTVGSFLVSNNFSARSKFKTTIIDGFEIYGARSSETTIRVGNKTQLILRHNIIYTNLAEVNWETYGDTHYGSAVAAANASLHAYHNRFLIPSDFPQQVISRGLSISMGCLLLMKNHFVSFRIPISSSNSNGVMKNNIIEDGYNGIWTRQEAMKIENNTIGLKAYPNGCGYAIYMESKDPLKPTQPVIVDNTIILEGGSAKGINEVDVSSDPAVLTGNHFVLLDLLPPQLGIQMLYGDADGPHSPNRVNQILSRIEDVAHLSDIPMIGNNTVESVGNDTLVDVKKTKKLD